MRTKTPEQSEKILTAAARLFATQRFHEARMDDIAASAEVGKGTLYRYFQDKDELYVALLERASDELMQRWDEAAAAVQGARAQLIAVIDAIVQFFDEQPHLFDLIQHAEAMRRSDSAFPWQQTRDESVRRILTIFDEGKRTGEFHIANPDVAVLMLLGGIRSVMRFGKKPRPANLARIMVDMFLHGATLMAKAQLPAPRRSRGLVRGQHESRQSK